MNCEELRDSFELYSLGLLEPGERNEIETHLARGCENCQTKLRDALAMNAMLLASTPAERPHSRLKRRVLATFGLSPAGWGWVGALAAACMRILALWLSVQERRRTAELAEARQAIMQVSAERDRVS